MNTINTQTSTARKGAEFSTDKAFMESSILVRSDASGLEYSGIPLDVSPSGGNEYATSKRELHAFIVGDTGCGKTRRLIIPSIRLIGKSGESMVISDPKGELYRKTSGGLKAHGYDIIVVNMRSPGRGQRWNPFAEVEKLYHAEGDENHDRAMLLIEDIVEVIHAPNRSDRDPYWDNIAVQYIKALIFMILKYGEGLSFGAIADLDKNLSRIMTNKRRSKQLLDFMASLDDYSPIKENMSAIADLVKGGVGSTLGCALSEAKMIISQYTRQLTIRRLLETSDFDISDIGRKPTALYIILPDDSEALYPIATLMVKQIYSSLINDADEKGGMLDNRVSFILDEFSNFTRLEAIGSMLTASRSRGIRFVLVCQNVGQLEEKYGKYGAETIRANCRVWVYMGCRNLEFLKMLQELSGIHVEKYGGGIYPLMDIDMLQRLAAGEVFVWNDRCSPKLCHLPDCSEYDFGSDDTAEVDLPPYRENDNSVSCDIPRVLFWYARNPLDDIEDDEDEDE